MSKSFVEPIESNYHHSNINDDNICRHRKPEHDKLDQSNYPYFQLGDTNLLPRGEEVHVDRIHACLTRCSRSKQHCIYICNLLACKDQQRSKQHRSNNVNICSQNIRQPMEHLTPISEGGFLGYNGL